MSKQKILLAEDDQDLGNVLKQYLQIEGFEVVHCLNGNLALKSFKEHEFDLCILDIMMPEMDGLRLAEKIKSLKPQIPFIFLTAKSMKEDRLTGLKIGADDYITKPFEADELVLRLKNILKRSKISGPEETLILENYQLDFENLKLKHPQQDQLLTLREAELLKYLILHKNQLIKNAEILENIWGEDDYFMGRSMNVFMSRIRKYLRFAKTITIENIRGVGYILNTKK